MRLESFRHHVLALLLVNDTFCATAGSILQPRFFENPSEQHLCRFILEHYREYQKAPHKIPVRNTAYEYFNKSKHLKSQLEEFDLLLDIVADIDKEAVQQYQYIQDTVVSFCKESAMKDALLKSVDDIQGGKFDVVLERVQKALAVGVELSGKGIYLLQDADQRQTVAEVREVVPTGCRWMDEPSRGGLAKGELCIIMAPPNTGKTTALINLGVGILKNRHSLAHFSGEMKKEIIRAKYDQCLLKKTDDYLANLDTEGQSHIANWMKKLHTNIRSDVNVSDFMGHKLSVADLRARIMLMRSRDSFSPDAILVDYMDLMEMPAHIKEPHLQLAWLGVELRGLAQELNVAIYTVTQTNRSGATKETAMGDDVSGDFTKFATCDFMASMNQTPKEVEEEIVRIFWIKNRFGGKHRTYKLMSDFERSLLSPA